MKPIVRWTIGNVSKNGIISLKYSIKKFINLYGNNFEYFLCYNNIDLSMNWLNDIKIEKINQNQLSEYSIDGYNPFWKLVPPRLDIKRHEIFIDNDLIIYNKIKEFEFFLSSKDLFLITQGSRKEKNGFTYGVFEGKINSEVYMNTGLLGFPPNFDLDKEIKNILKQYKIKNHFDEQGMISFIIQSKNKKIILKEKINFFQNGSCGIHLIGINSGKNKKSINKLIKIL